MSICMVCYDDKYGNDNFFCCNMCLLEIYNKSICNKQDIPLLDIIKKIHYHKLQIDTNIKTK